MTIVCTRWKTLVFLQTISEMVTNFNKTSFVSWTAIQKDRHAKKNKVNQFSCFIVGCLGKFLDDIFHDYKYFAPSFIT